MPKDSASDVRLLAAIDDLTKRDSAGRYVPPSSLATPRCSGKYGEMTWKILIRDA